jgi:SAM-dependent MidA family methyltransferase
MRRPVGPPTDAAAEKNADERLEELLRTAAGADGFLPFDRWMELVLYAEGVGYYARPRSPLGVEGDFYTASHVHPLFAAAFARRVGEVRERLGRDRPFTLVELGPGDGTLAAGIVSALGPSWAAGGDVRVVLIERSSLLRTAALARTRGAGQPHHVPVSTAESISVLGPFEGVVIANEFLDAQPARRLRWHSTGWRELGVRFTAEGLTAVEGARVELLPDPPLPTSVEEGTILEFSPLGEALVREVADHLVSGVWLLADYGMEETELLRAHPGGTLATVRGHRAGSDPFATPGEQDLSVFLNWTRLRTVGRAAGFEVIADRSQAETLGAWGLPGLLDDALARAGSAEAEVRLRLAVKNLLFGYERFRVLELAPARLADRFRPTSSG